MSDPQPPQVPQPPEPPQAPADEQSADSDGMPTTTQLEEPSTEKPVDEEPKAPDDGSGDTGEPSHEATGLGVVE